MSQTQQGPGPGQQPDVSGPLGRVVAGENLSAEEMAAVIGAFMDGEPHQAQIGALLTALRMKGETVDEVVGAARAMRARMVALPFEEDADAPLVDTCGTGGDGSGSVNISTLAAFVVAGCGGPVAKHGNRALSSRSGSHDVIEALGLDPAPAPPLAATCVREAGLGFMFAPLYHGATKQVAMARKKLGFRTLFNVLGPLTNPAGDRYHVNGVYARDRVAFVAEAHARLGSTRALVVHGTGGLDEVAVAGETFVAELCDEAVRTYAISPASFGLEECDPAGLAGGAPEHNARLLLETLEGAKGAIRAAAVMNAAAAVYVAGRAPNLQEAARLAEASIDDGRARAVLDRLRSLCPVRREVS